MDKVDALIAEGRLDEAVSEMTRMLAEMYFRRGKLYWRLGRRADATSDYAKASALDPDSPANKALEQARDIDSFFNPDLYNP